MELLFHRVYEIADLMALNVDSSYAFEDLYWDSPVLSNCLNKFSKTSLLGHFCYTHIRLHDLKQARKNPEDVDIEGLEQALHNYAIPFVTLKEFISRGFPEQQEDANIEDEAYDEAVHSWMLEQEDAALGLLWEKMTNEVVHLLFGNRGFLLRFNVELAEFRRERGDAPSQRCAIPQWVKRAVYFRENGKCALCKKDLSGLIAVDPKQHYDHIVPLKALGANDPCNMQLLCAQCNLTKSASAARTSAIYDPWWK